MGRAMHLRLPWTSPVVLALGTWLIYVADRILDGLPTPSAARLRERHFFYARNRGTINGRSNRCLHRPHVPHLRPH